MTAQNDPAWSAASAPLADSGSLWTGALSTLLALILVLGLAWLFLRGLKRLQLRRGVSGGEAPQLVSSLPISPRDRLVVVAYRGQHHLLAFSPGGVCVVDRHPLEPAHHTEPAPANASPPVSR
jgi:flagellar protein FliO/FliZ